MENVAEHVISKLSPQILAEICGVNVSTVHKWKYPKSRGGTDGLIPAPYQQMIKDGAPKYGVKIRADDFFIPLPIKNKKRLNKGQK